MKVVASFSTPAEAHVAMTRLVSAGVYAGIRDEFTITFDWFMSNAIGGVKIEVADEDFSSAREILALSPSEEGMIRCPHCGSADTRVRVLSVFGAVCMMLKLPIPMSRAIIDCRGCSKTHDVARNGRNA